MTWAGDNPSYYQDWYIDPTPQQLANHVRDAVDFVSANPGSCEARAILMYAWNEFDEGGWVCPTLYNGTARLDAIRAALDN